MRKISSNFKTIKIVNITDIFRLYWLTSKKLKAYAKK